MRILMLGTGPFAVPTLRNLARSTAHDLLGLVTKPDRGSHRRPSHNPMRDAAQALELPIWEVEDVNRPEFITELQNLDVDLLVVCDFGQILSAACLAATRLGGINLHGSLLPRYRGAAPIQWALRNGDTVTGNSVIHMSPRLDSGPILAQQRVPIDPSENAVELERRLAELGPEAVLESIAQLAIWDGSSPLGRAQDATLATRAPRIKKQDGLIHWERTAQQIHDQVRALQPWPGTHTFWQRKPQDLLRLIVRRTRPPTPQADPGDTAVPPGQVVSMIDDRLWIACGTGRLEITAIQPAGKKELSAAEFLRGYSLNPGDQFCSAEKSNR